MKQEEPQYVPFQVGDETMLLPEVLSNLDFSADSKPASDDDIEGQLRLRDTRFWGRMYIDGWPQTIQYFRAHFGNGPPLGRKKIVFAEPRNACQQLENAEHLNEDYIVIANRGVCTYGTKAKNVMASNVSAIVIVNNEPGVDHLPGPDAHDIDFSVASIAQPEGQLLEVVYDESPVDPVTGFRRVMEGYMVPINCPKSGDCIPTTVDEKRAITKLVEGGTLELLNSDGSVNDNVVKDMPIEYLLAHFGTKVPEDTLDIVVAKPAEACVPLENEVKGKIVLVRRGSCPFVKKAEMVQDAGGRVMIMGNMQANIIRMGVEPRWKGLDIAIPVLMVSKRSYAVLVAESYMGGKIKIKEDEGLKDELGNISNMTINNNVWEYLEKLSKGEEWPRSDAYVKKKFLELSAQYAAWPDRLLSLKEAVVTNYGKEILEDGAKREEL